MMSEPAPWRGVAWRGMAWHGGILMQQHNRMTRIFPRCTPLSDSKRNMEMDYASIQPALTTLLRNRPLGTTADINKQTVAYWDGHEVRGIHLRHDESDKSDRLDGDFDLDERTLNQLYADLIAWMAAPRYTVRAELVDWLKDAPPSNAGA
jgi:hypothetical protein